jgi:hypothetical protein
MFTVIETNFTKSKPWLFKLKETSGDICYIMDADFYKQNGIKSPIDKHKLDTLDVGHTLRGKTKEMLGTNVLTNIY